MNTYDDLVNDYLRAVEQALAGVPASRRDELLSDLSQHIAAKRAELTPDQETEVEVRSILELLGDPEDVAEAMIDADPEPPIVIQPGKRLGAVVWVAITIAAVSTLCVAMGLVGVFFFVRSEGSTPPSEAPAPQVSITPLRSASPAPSATPS